jgi:N-acetylglucosaminyldiphosphoundecaprenol N-acetyl-beta-D-mannosaminyltransferase
MNRVAVLTSKISTGTYNDFLKNIIKLSEEKSSSYVCVSNVHMTIEAYMGKEFCTVVNSADIATPDGMPIAKAIKYLYGIEQDRVAGMDLMPDIMKASEEQGLSIYLYGSTDEVLETIKAKAAQEFPKLKLYTYSPPFKELSVEEKFKIVEEINSKNPDFVFVALGCPKQEKWMAEHKGKIHSCMIGLGGAFEVYAGVKDRAPKWMQKSSLEWFYRLVQDPKRLFKRYLMTNTLFIILFFKQYIYQNFKNLGR